MTRTVMWFLLTVVATAAAVLSFSALRDLAVLCGFSPRLAWLLPVVVDAGAATGCLVWLRAAHDDDRHLVARRFARALTWLLLASSVAGNAVTHYLTAYQLHPVWWLVVMVSAVAPTVLGAVVHLAVLVGRPGAGTADAGPHDLDLVETAGSDGASDLPAGLGRRRLAQELDISEYQARKILAAKSQALR